jgi:hypothetical protein
MERRVSAVKEGPPAEPQRSLVERMLRFARAFHGEDPTPPLVRTGHSSKHPELDTNVAARGLDMRVMCDPQRERAKRAHPSGWNQAHPPV